VNGPTSRSTTVFGSGGRDADVMLVGEQPGDKEDLAGQPFVGPAGKLLDQALAEVGIDRGIPPLVAHRGAGVLAGAPRCLQDEAMSHSLLVAVLSLTAAACLGNHGAGPRQPYDTTGTGAFLDTLHEYPWPHKPARGADLG